MQVCASEASDVRIDEVEKRLRSLGITEAELPINTVRRWSAAKLLPKPESIYHAPEGGPGRYGEWPPETVEQAAAIHMARNSLETATIKRVKLTMLKEAKRLVDAFYAFVEEFNRTGDPQVLLKFDTLQKEVELPDGKRGVVLGGWDLNTLVVTWIATLEKVRHREPLFEPKTVRFSWNWHVVRELGRDDLQMKYDGVTFESSPKDAVGRHEGSTREALAKLRADWPANRRGFHRADIIDKDTDWHRIHIDPDKQLVVVEFPGTKGLLIVDLTGSGFGICTDDMGPGRRSK
jgi:hypothetical protein